MDYKDKNSREIWLEMRLAGLEKRNVQRDYYERMTINLFGKMIEEYESGKTPHYVQETVEQFKEKRKLTGYQWWMLWASYSYLIDGEELESIGYSLKRKAVQYLYRLSYVDEQNIYSFRNMYNALEERKSRSVNELTKQSTGGKGGSFGGSSSDEEMTKLAERKQQLLSDIKVLEEEKSQRAQRSRELQAEIISFEEQKKNIRDEVNVLMQQELVRARKSLDEEMNKTRNEKLFALEAELCAAYEIKKAEALEKLETDTLYEARKKELEKLMDSSEVLYKQQEAKKAEVLEQMTQMKLQFKVYHDDMERQLQEMQEKIHSEYVGAINKVVMVEREMQQEKVEALIENCAELQRTCYYQRDEKELGLAPSRVESYLNRFMRELKKCGFEAELPEIGEAFDYEKHEVRESKNDEIEEYYGSLEDAVVTEVISYAFKRVDDGSYVRKAEVVVGGKSC